MARWERYGFDIAVGRGIRGTNKPLFHDNRPYRVPGIRRSVNSSLLTLNLRAHFSWARVPKLTAPDSI